MSPQDFYHQKIFSESRIFPAFQGFVRFFFMNIFPSVIVPVQLSPNNIPTIVSRGFLQLAGPYPPGTVPSGCSRRVLASQQQLPPRRVLKKTLGRILHDNPRPQVSLPHLGRAVHFRTAPCGSHGGTKGQQTSGQDRPKMKARFF